MDEVNDVFEDSFCEVLGDKDSLLTYDYSVRSDNAKRDTSRN